VKRVPHPLSLAIGGANNLRSIRTVSYQVGFSPLCEYVDSPERRALTQEKTWNCWTIYLKLTTLKTTAN